MFLRILECVVAHSNLCQVVEEVLRILKLFLDCKNVDQKAGKSTFSNCSLHDACSHHSVIRTPYLIILTSKLM